MWSRNRRIEANLAAAAIIILAFIIVYQLSTHILTITHDVSIIPVVLAEAVFASFLCIVAYFDSRQKSWALVASVLVGGLEVTNALSVLGEGMPTTITFQDWLLLVVSIVIIVTSLLAFSSLKVSKVELHSAEH